MFASDRALTRRESSAAIACFALIGLACSEHDALLEVKPAPPVVQFVTGAAAASLTADGLFVPSGAIQWAEQQIDPGRATELAKAYVRVHIRGHLDILQRDRGRHINHAVLEPCGRTYYSEPALLPIPAREFAVVRRAHGPYWIVSLCGTDAAPEVSLAVSALATDVQLIDGLPRYDSGDIQGEWFRPLGVRVGSEGIPASPETAVAEVAKATGRKVTTVPRLIRFPRRYPQSALWLMELDAEARFALGSGGERTSRIVLYGDDHRTLRPHIWIPAEDQPNSAEYIGVTRVRPGRLGEHRGSVGRRLGVPLVVEAVREVLP